MMELAIGVLASLGIGYLFYYLPKKSQEKMEEYTKKSLEIIHDYNEFSKDVLVSMRNDDLRLFMKVFDGEGRSYWHFKWRFETWDDLGINVKISEDVFQYLQIEILGTTEDYRKQSMNSHYEYYICQVSEVNNEDGPYRDGDRVACFYFNDKRYISHYIGAITEPDEKNEFTIVGLGNTQVGFGGDHPVSNVEYHPRAKDMRLSK